MVILNKQSISLFLFSFLKSLIITGPPECQLCWWGQAFSSIVRITRFGKNDNCFSNHVSKYCHLDPKHFCNKNFTVKKYLQANPNSCIR